MIAETDIKFEKNGCIIGEKPKNFKDRLSLIKNTFPEVTFCNLSEHTDSSYNNNNNLNKKSNKKQLTNDDTSIDSITLSSEKKKPNIPDGGYGWVVVFSSLVVSLIADGISFSFGLIYTELLSYFRESKSKTAWIGSLFLAVPLLVGPIMSNLVDKYGCRKMTIIGGLLSSSGFALASICNSIETLYITFGIISGLGLGIGYVSAVVSIAFWFDKNRTFANGIGASGTGIGTFLYAPFTQWLIEYFGWRGATLILAGTMLNTCICGCLMKDPEWLIEENNLESRSQSVTTFSNSSICLDEIKKLLEVGTPKEALLDTLVTNYNTEANQQILDPCQNNIIKKYNSEIFLPTYYTYDDNINTTFNEYKNIRRRSLQNKIKINDDNISQKNLLSLNLDKNKDKKYLASIETLSPSEKISTILSTSVDSNELINNSYYDYLNNHKNHISRYSLNENFVYKQNSIQHKYRNASLNILSYNNNKKTIFNNILTYENEKDNHINISKNYLKSFNHKTFNNYFRANLKENSVRNSNFLKGMRIHRNSIHYRGAMLNTHRYRLRASSCPNIYRNSMTTIAREEDEKWYDNFVDVIKSMFDMSLFLDAKFAIFNMSTLLLFIWFIIPYFYITEHMLRYNYKEEDSAMLISIIGIFNTISMVGLGFIGDRPWLNVSKTYAVCLVFCGLSVALMPLFVTNYSMLIALSVLFGITFASSFSFTPSILVSIVDLDDFTCAYGLVLLVQGIGSLIGPPLAGVIYDITLRWDDAFYAAGLFIAISGVLAYLIAILEDRDKLKNVEIA